eukprot:PRCOL_00003411-RA
MASPGAVRARAAALLLLLLDAAAVLGEVGAAAVGPPLGLAAAARRLAAAGGGAPPRAPAHQLADVSSCEERWFAQTTDHFGFAPPAGGALAPRFRQRYFLCVKSWKASPLPPAQRPVLFYFGNEDNVELYVNHTGLMWENADRLGAALLFVEHRYYGESTVPPAEPNGTLPRNPSCLNYLTTDQALADFATVLMSLDSVLPGARRGVTPVVGFGGSYGGMMAAWFRLKFPHLVDGVISASAPIWSFFGLTPAYDADGFMRVVTRDAQAAGGAAPSCAANAKEAFRRILKAGQTAAGRALLAEAFRTCAPLRDAAAAAALNSWAQAPWATLAMGNFPYPSTYLMHGLSLLPAWPVRAACEPLRDPALASGEDAPLFEALRAAVAVYYNNTGGEGCFFNAPAASVADVRDDTCVGNWDWQWCTEMHQPFTQGTAADMFYPLSAYNQTAAFASCQAQWGVTPRPLWAATTWWGSDLSRASNIVFSNGELDPWSAGGVTKNVSLARDVTAVVLPNGAHHLDLMFAHKRDPPDAVEARRYELAAITRWIEAKRGVAAT